MSKPMPPAGRLAYNISEFCQLIGRSRPWFYNLPADQRPKVIERGGAKLIPADEVRRFLEVPA
ncbi:hypothetical protein [Bradyrhizobium liaoningense]